jgi:hypothetical protein
MQAIHHLNRPALKAPPIDFGQDLNFKLAIQTQVHNATLIADPKINVSLFLYLLQNKLSYQR